MDEYWCRPKDRTAFTSTFWRVSPSVDLRGVGAPSVGPGAPGRQILHTTTSRKSLFFFERLPLCCRIETRASIHHPLLMVVVVVAMVMVVVVVVVY